MRKLTRGFIGVLAMGAVSIGAIGASHAAIPEAPGAAAGMTAIDLGSNFAGWVHAAEGGNAYADVIEEKLGPDHIIRKHLGNVKYGEITVHAGTGMSKQFYQWIQDSFDHKYTRKDGAILDVNYNHKEISRLSFYHALITEVGFPALDASSKDAALLTLKFAPETTRRTQNLGGGPAVAGTLDPKVQKKWLAANFRLQIAGLDTSRVNKIDAITVKQKNTENAVGQQRDYQQEPSHIEIPNLVITLPESHAESIYKWHEDFVIKGNNGQDKEKSGTLEILTPNLQEELFTLHFNHLGIVKVEPVHVEAGSEAIRNVKATFFVEEIKFEPKAIAN